jgi:hypothetical protein
MFLCLDPLTFQIGPDMIYLSLYVFTYTASATD